MYSYEYPHPAVTTDAVVFTIESDCLKVLLIQRGQYPCKGDWAFPGGFLNIGEDLHIGVARELQEETGLRGIPLEQFRAFGQPDRDPRERVITVAYLGLVVSANLRLQAADDAADAGWFALDDLPSLAFDHAEVLRLAHLELMTRTGNSRLAESFLPRIFSVTDLENFAAIVGMQNHAGTLLRDRLLANGMIATAGDAGFQFRR